MIFCIQAENYNSSGIYIIRNTIDNRVYVGSAINLIRRYYTHLCDLKSNKHHNARLQNFVNKYGIEILRFQLLKIV